MTRIPLKPLICREAVFQHVDWLGLGAKISIGHGVGAFDERVRADSRKKKRERAAGGEPELAAIYPFERSIQQAIQVPVHAESRRAAEAATGLADQAMGVRGRNLDLIPIPLVVTGRDGWTAARRISDALEQLHVLQQLPCASAPEEFGAAEPGDVRGLRKQRLVPSVSLAPGRGVD